MPVNELDERYALITLEEARLYCFRSAGDSTRDELLIDAINDVSGSIWDYCQREFKPTTPATVSTNAPGTGGTSLQVASATGAAAIAFPQTGTFKIRMGTETMLVTAGAGSTTWTVTRAQDGTTAVAHPIGTAVVLLDERVFDYAGQGQLSLAPHELRSLTAAKLYTDLEAARQVTLTTAQYRLEPAGRSRAGTYLSLTVPYPSFVESEYGFAWQATITGEWGMASVPPAVKLGCKIWVDNIVRNPGDASSHSMNGYTFAPGVDPDPTRFAGMPAATRHRLERWRRGRAGGLRSVRFANDASVAPHVPHTLPTV